MADGDDHRNVNAYIKGNTVYADGHLQADVLSGGPVAVMETRLGAQPAE